jgi:hypothetical protein
LFVAGSSQVRKSNVRVKITISCSAISPSKYRSHKSHVLVESVHLHLARSEGALP